MQKSNAGQVRTDDYSLIGAAIAAILVPAMFLRRAPLPDLVLGGAAIGLGAGVWTHTVQAMQEGEDVRPEGMVGDFTTQFEVRADGDRLGRYRSSAGMLRSNCAMQAVSSPRYRKETRCSRSDQ